MAATLVASNSGTANAGSVTVSLVVPASARLILVHYRSDTPATGWTFDGDNMTEVIKSAYGSSAYGGMYMILAPEAGTYDCVISHTAGIISAVVTAWSGVDINAPIVGTATANGSSGTPSVNTTAAANQTVVDCLALATTVTPTAGADQTEIAKNTRVAASYENTLNATMSWSMSSTGWVICAAWLKPSGGYPKGCLV